MSHGASEKRKSARAREKRQTVNPTNDRQQLRRDSAPETFGWRLGNRGCISLQRETPEDCCGEHAAGDLDTGDVVVFG
jgi:hypothetical protein